jgi:hypothetical protein
MTKPRGRSSSHRGKMPTQADREVGYGRPPVAHQFKPGQPRGRPKGAKNEATIVSDLLNRKVDVRQGPARRKISVHEAILLRFTEAALKGNTKAAAFLFNRYAGKSDTERDDDLNADDQEVLDAFARRLEAQRRQKRRRP